jgi:hypothetical protein
MQEQKENKQTKSDTTNIEDEINYDGFIETQREFREKIEKSSEGIATLKSAELIDKKDVPQSYSSKYGSLCSHYLRFEGTFTDLDKDIKIYCPASSGGHTIKVAKKWTDSDSIKELSGSQVPVRNIEDDVYRIEGFRKVSSLPYPSSISQYFAQEGLLSYKEGSWGTSTRLKIMEVSVILSSIIFFYMGFVFAG